MQQTFIDRWLRKKFVYVCKVYSNTLPEEIPTGVVLEETSGDSGGRYCYCFTVRDDRQMSALTATLEASNITYTSRVTEREGTRAKLFNNPEKSFTMQVAWIVLILILITIAFSGLPVRLWTYLSAEEEESGKKPAPSAAPARPGPVL